jgi:alcohol dehydrogenase
MPHGLTLESGIDAMAHCIKGYVSLALPYHPYFEAMVIYGVKLIGRSLIQAYKIGNDIATRTDMCMASICGKANAGDFTIHFISCRFGPCASYFT